MTAEQQPTGEMQPSGEQKSSSNLITVLDGGAQYADFDSTKL